MLLSASVVWHSAYSQASNLVSLFYCSERDSVIYHWKNLNTVDLYERCCWDFDLSHELSWESLLEFIRLAFPSATVDRWLASSTNVRRQQFIALGNVRRSTMDVIEISCVVYTNVLYDDGTLQTDTPTLVLMRLFGLMEIPSVQDGQRRNRMFNREANFTVKPKRNIPIRSIVPHLVKMLLVEVVPFGVLIIWQAVGR